MPWRSAFCGRAASRAGIRKPRRSGRPRSRTRSRFGSRCRRLGGYSRTSKRKWAGQSPAISISSLQRSVFQPARGVGKQRIDLAGVRREIRAGEALAAVVARHLVEQALELLDVAVDGVAELGGAPVAPADLVEGLLAVRGIEPAAHHVALPALVAVPQLHRRVMVDHAGDVAGERVERLDRLQGRAALAFAVAVGSARQEIAEPAGALAVLLATLAGGRPARLGGNGHLRRELLFLLARRGARGGARQLRHRRLLFARGAARGRGFLAAAATTAIVGGGGDAAGLGEIDAAAMAGDDVVQLRQGLDLVGDDAAHGGGAFARLLGQLQHAALQLLAGELERTLHFLRHVAQLARGDGEALVHLVEQAAHLLDGLLIGGLERDRGAAALLGVGAADELVLVGDRLGRRGGGLGDEVRRFPRAGLGLAERLLQELVEGGEAFAELVGAAGELALEVARQAAEQRHDLLDRGAAVGERLVDAAVGLAESLGDAGDELALVLEAQRQRREVAQHAARDFAQVRDLAARPVDDRAGGVDRALDRGLQRGKALGERRFHGAKVAADAFEHDLELDVGLLELLEHAGHVGAQALAGEPYLLGAFKQRARHLLGERAERALDLGGVVAQNLGDALDLGGERVGDGGAAGFDGFDDGGELGADGVVEAGDVGVERD